MQVTQKKTANIANVTNADFEKLEQLCKFGVYPENISKRDDFILDLDSIISFTNKILEFEPVDNNNGFINTNRTVSLSELREDVFIKTATPEQLLSNTESIDDCYIIPKVVE